MRKVHILYTEEEGGNFQYLAKEDDQATIDFYNLTVKKGVLEHTQGSRLIRIKPNLMCLVRNFEEFDFNNPLGIKEEKDAKK